MKYAIIENGVVGEVVRVNPARLFQAGYAAQFVEVPDEVEQFWRFDGEHYSAPPEPPPVIPSSVTMRQARLALLATGKLAAVDAAIAGMDSPQKEAAQIEWEYAAIVERQSPLIAALAPALELDAAGVDALFSAAAAL